MGASGSSSETKTEGADTGSASDSGPRGLEPGASAERLLLFTDAVAAISITLLILPLVDLVPEAVSAHEAPSKVITDHLDQIWSFLLSFLVISNIWLEHHRTFASVGKLTRPLMVWNMGWLLAVVVLPLPTEMIGAFGRDSFVATFYYATLLASMVCRSAMLRILTTTPELLKDDVPGAHRRTADLYTEGYLNVIAVVVALLLALAVPALQYYSLLLLVVPRRILRFRGRAGAR
ncbi:TMEM175 family protein [Streptomyces sp. NPDC059142]|uniref:TMEM175 family protein n=1 Tax=Streptomyces sp. NPDC059142 TaxID=3346739 RepID=UPI003687CCFF